jgi:hypothetical protein
MSEEKIVSETISYVLRDGSKQGTKHVRLGINNQDARVSQSISVPAFGKQYHVGIVSDGCTGQPLFSHTEVGAHLMSLYAYRRIQELICSKLPLQQIPQVLYPSVTEFMLDLTNKVMPSHVVWKYPIKVNDRENYSGQARFRTDYLAATIVGFISDEEDLVVFSAGDGVVLVNDDLTIIDHNDHPDYPVISVNKPSNGFVTESYKMSEVNRVAVSSDGLKQLLQNLEFRAKLFEFQGDKFHGLQTLLNVQSNNTPELMQDDCTVVTLAR